MKKLALPLAAAVAVAGLLVQAPPAAQAAPAAKSYRNCTELNKVYKHGVAKKGARDKVSGKSKPVRNFTVNSAVYAKNTKLDRDRDGVACEKR